MEDLKEPIVNRDPGDENDARERPPAELHVSPNGAHWIRWADGRETGPFWVDENGSIRESAP